MNESIETSDAKVKRSWKSIAGELFLWSLVAVATALILVYFSESLLPANF